MNVRKTDRVEIRAGGRSDADEAARLWHEIDAEAHPWVSEMTRKEQIEMLRMGFERLPHNGRVLVVNGELQGFAYLDWPAGHPGHLYWVGVVKGHRGSGHGKALLDALKAMDPGPASITLDVWSKNVSAVRFYLREGFHEQPGDARTAEGQLRMVWIRDPEPPPSSANA